MLIKIITMPNTNPTDNSRTIDFFFDPVCPWAWITSRWVVNLTEMIDLSVNWKFISLKELNSHRTDLDYTDEYKKIHNLGRTLHRIIAGSSLKEGEAIRGKLYSIFGYKIHNEGKRDELFENSGIEKLLEENNFDPAFVNFADDSTLDQTIIDETKLALERAGKDLGTPVITFDPPEGYSFFGPVMSTIPKGEETLKLFNAIYTLASHRGFSELKREIREPRSFD